MTNKTCCQRKFRFLAIFSVETTNLFTKVNFRSEFETKDWLGVTMVLPFKVLPFPIIQQLRTNKRRTEAIFKKNKGEKQIIACQYIQSSVIFVERIPENVVRQYFESKCLVICWV